MSSFSIIEHQIPGQHIREYIQATANAQEQVLYLSVKQYIPLNNPTPSAGDVTIIAAQANALPKELYEPLWDDLLVQSAKQGWRIRGIWMADCAQLGDSGVINAAELGNDPSWFDYSRDLLHLINLKREEMPRPLIGIGHSMGGCQLAYLSLMHPRLLTSLVLLDPTISALTMRETQAYNMTRLSTFRRTQWPSREEASAAFKKSAFYKTWDQRVFDKFIEFGLRDTKPADNDTISEVALKTPVGQEVYSYLRPNFQGYGNNGKPVNRITHPDLDPWQGENYPFYRSEASRVHRQLEELRPGVLYVFGEKSPVSAASENAAKLSRTGSGVGGSGGVKEGRVKGVTIEKVGHLIPMEAPQRTAEVVAEWVGLEAQRFRGGEMRLQDEWARKSLREKQEISETWKEMVRSGTRNAKM